VMLRLRRPPRGPAARDGVHRKGRVLAPAMKRLHGGTLISSTGGKAVADLGLIGRVAPGAGAPAGRSRAGPAAPPRKPSPTQSKARPSASRKGLPRGGPPKQGADHRLRSAGQVRAHQRGVAEQDRRRAQPQRRRATGRPARAVRRKPGVPKAGQQAGQQGGGA
jgi:hypothetical protein